MPQRAIYFPPFCLDLTLACLWQGAEQVSLIPKDFAILSYLAKNPHRLISHEELLRSVWGNIIVSRGVLKVHLCRIRQALNDDATRPQFIETIPRRGYRFIAPVEASFPSLSLEQGRICQLDSTLRDLHAALALVDRKTNFEQLNEWLDDTLRKVRSLTLDSPPQRARAA